MLSVTFPSIRRPLRAAGPWLLVSALAGAIAAGAPSARAADESSRCRGWGLVREIFVGAAETCPRFQSTAVIGTFENDLLTDFVHRQGTGDWAELLPGKNEDHFFTVGLGFDTLYIGKRETRDDGSVRRESFGINRRVLTFTGENIQDGEPRPGDRPYAGVLLIGLRRDRSTVTPEPEPAGGFDLDWLSHRFEYAEFALGVIGPFSQGGSSQIWAHDHTSIHSSTPQGWRNQIRTDVLLQVNLEYVPATVGLDLFRARRADLAPVLRVEGGTLYTNVQFGTVLRLAVLGEGLGPYVTSPSGHLFYNADAGDDHWQLGLYARHFWKRIFYDATLQGGVFNRESPYTVEPVPYVRDLEYGAALSVGGWALSLSFVRRSPEILGTDPDSPPLDQPEHWFGRLSLIRVMDP